MNEVIDQGRTRALQVILETYLLTTNKGTLKEVLAHEGYEYGKMTDSQLALLHFYLLDEYKEYGLNLIEEIEKNGETVVPGKLSSYEFKELTKRADKFITALGVIEKIKKTATN